MKQLQKYFKVLVITLTMLTAEEISAQNIGGGVIGGFNFTQITGDGEAGFRKIGLNTGLMGIIPIKNKWNIHLEMLYTQKGSRLVFSPVFQVLKYNYIEVPVYANFIDRGKYNFGAGITYAQLMEGKTASWMPTIEDWEVGILLNFYTKLSGKLNINFRYQTSFLRIADYVNQNGQNRGVVHSSITARLIFLLRDPLQVK